MRKLKTKNVDSFSMQPLSEQEVYDVLKFADSIYSQNYSNPWLINEQMKNISMNNSKTANYNEVLEALKNPKNSEEKLQGYSEYFELTSMLYKRVLLYYSTLLSFNLSINCINAFEEKDYKSKEYKRDYSIVKDFLNHFDIEREFKKIVKMIVRDEVCFTAFWDNGRKYHFQQLPSNYCMITGRWDYGFCMDFDLTYFLNPAVDINMFPQEMRQYFNEFINDGENYKQYVASNLVNERNSLFAFWRQTDPRVFWTFKFSPEIVTRVPFLSALFPEVALQPLMLELQKNQNIIKASKLIAGEVPLLKGQKGGVVQDAVAYNPKTLGKFLSVFKAGLADIIKVAGAPLNNLKEIEFQYTDNTTYDDFNKTIASLSGNSRLLFSSEKQNAVESQLAINMDENIMSTLYSQFEDFLNYVINERTIKYKFKFKLNGYNTFTHRKDYKDNVLAMAEKGVIYPDGFAHILGFNNRIELENNLMMVQATGFVEKLSMLPNMYNQKNALSDSGNVGRPSKADGEISESGTGTTNTSSNDNKI